VLLSRREGGIRRACVGIAAAAEAPAGGAGGTAGGVALGQDASRGS
jgi:hypothetical protein